MAARFQERTIVPRATPAFDESGHPLYESVGTTQKKRRSWNKPEPSGYVQHFKSAGTKLAHKLGKMPLAQATVDVPIYRGIANNVFRSLISWRKYEQKRLARAQVNEPEVTDG